MEFQEKVIEEDIRNKIMQLKADVYELIKQQELLVLKNNQIQDEKFRKVLEIQKLEEQYRDPSVPWGMK